MDTKREQQPVPAGKSALAMHRESLAAQSLSTHLPAAIIKKMKPGLSHVDTVDHVAHVKKLAKKKSQHLLQNNITDIPSIDVKNAKNKKLPKQEKDGTIILSVDIQNARKKRQEQLDISVAASVDTVGHVLEHEKSTWLVALDCNTTVVLLSSRGISFVGETLLRVLQGSVHVFGILCEAKDEQHHLFSPVTSSLLRIDPIVTKPEMKILQSPSWSGISIMPVKTPGFSNVSDVVHKFSISINTSPDHVTVILLTGVCSPTRKILEGVRAYRHVFIPQGNKHSLGAGQDVVFSEKLEQVGEGQEQTDKHTDEQEIQFDYVATNLSVASLRDGPKEPVIMEINNMLPTSLRFAVPGLPVFVVPATWRVAMGHFLDHITRTTTSLPTVIRAPILLVCGGKNTGKWCDVMDVSLGISIHTRHVFCIIILS